jgi:type IV pilus assembly protein PilM
MPEVVAIDLGSSTVKAIQGKPGNTIQVSRAFETINPVGMSSSTDETSAEKLTELIKNIFTDHRLATTDVHLSLPETLVSTKIISIPPLSDAELASAIQWQAEQYIPIPKDELTLEYQVLFRPDRRQRDAQMRVLLVGARKMVIDKYLDLFLRVGIEPTVLETQTLSLFRSLQFELSDPPSLIIDIGASSTIMATVHQGELSFVYNYPSGGQVMTRAIEQSLQVDAKQAEQYKRTYGLDATQMQGRTREVLLPVLKLTLMEIQKAMQFYATQFPPNKISRILLSGGGAQLLGLAQYMGEQLGTEVLTASPFAASTGDLPPTNQTAYTVAMGLLMREKS